MDKSYSILIHPQQGTRIRHLVVSRRSIRILACVVLTLLGFSGWLLADYLWMKVEREEIKIPRDQLKVEVAALRTQVIAQRENLLSLKERIETSRQLLTETKLERDHLKVQGAHLNEKVTALSAGLKEELAAVNARHQEEVTTLRTRLKDGLAAMKAERQGEVTKLKSKHKEELNTLRAQVQVQQEKLLALRDRAKASQQLLVNWKGLRKKIQDSLPRKRRSSLKGQQVVRELETLLSSLESELEGLIASMPSEWPTKGRLSSRFGRRRSPCTGKSKFHSGIDIANLQGTPVYASGDAVVEFAGVKGGNGKTIVLKHGQGITTLYGHLSKIYVKKGDRVRKNQKIANLGNTGKSTSSHLHYEVRVNGIPIDPRRKLLKRNSPSSKRAD
ncbi:MAG: peptidoglycan DD-metalloendopeptidase family protein [Deltaproteobacteria bacterium]|nr:peptidoglycan DD-metalloendopeptidase family protein [Deltaproteobacteria bacterium]